MNVVVIFFVCATICAPIVVNGLECYECILCSSPFNKDTVNITSTTDDSCFKTTAAGEATIRGATASCMTTNILGYGRWCCNTDLCNAAESIVKMNSKLFISAMLFAITVIKMIH